MSGKAKRLARLFNRDENAVIIAADHGEFDGPIPGMVRIEETLRRIDPAVDAVLLSPGIVARATDLFGAKGAPLAIMRLNWSTVFCSGWNYREARTVPAVSAAEAQLNVALLNKEKLGSKESPGVFNQARAIEEEIKIRDDFLKKVQ